MQDTKIADENYSNGFQSFNELYDEAIEVGLLPKKHQTKDVFAKDSPGAQEALWFSLFNGYVERKYDSKTLKIVNPFTIENFTNCVKERQMVDSERRREKNDKLQKKKKLWGIKGQQKTNTDSGQYLSELENYLAIIEPSNDEIDKKIENIKYHTEKLCQQAADTKKLLSELPLLLLHINQFIVAYQAFLSNDVRLKDNVQFQKVLIPELDQSISRLQQAQKTVESRINYLSIKKPKPQKILLFEYFLCLINKSLLLHAFKVQK